ncbi:MAG: glycogen/starch synthase, partial [Proteobacteria bacterium]|nr:glycogen/starch synthase [Pseudomonadota bacterium]
MVKDALNVLFLSPEVVPFAKSGGLADVAGSLPIALKRLGLDLLFQILDEVLELDMGLVVLGSGDEQIQEAI